MQGVFRVGGCMMDGAWGWGVGWGGLGEFEGGFANLNCGKGDLAYTRIDSFMGRVRPAAGRMARRSWRPAQTR